MYRENIDYLTTKSIRRKDDRDLLWLNLECLLCRSQHSGKERKRINIQKAKTKPVRKSTTFSYVFTTPTLFQIQTQIEMSELLQAANQYSQYHRYISLPSQRFGYIVSKDTYLEILSICAFNINWKTCSAFSASDIHYSVFGFDSRGEYSRITPAIENYLW